MFAPPFWYSNDLATVSSATPALAFTTPAKSGGQKRFNTRRFANGAKLKSRLHRSIKRHLPFMAIGASEAARRHLKVATLNPYCLTVKQCVSHLLTS
jgi:hypothetical protein